ncbi:hypothetical protein LSH36_283g02022 [Paralvinella palmiformis]|uniref:Uncharacterized protein n=1 Tax=Paralvinella palmiformis TaxID=53620 RepID=A0AAD9JJH5_9ANNE|nr:hypothetical protein LSH36_283g02022 [Paralvinella palmiformis]
MYHVCNGVETSSICEIGVSRKEATKCLDVTQDNKHLIEGQSKDIQTDDIWQTIHSCLAEALEKKKAPTALNKNELKIKCEYQGEKRVIQIARPVQYNELINKIKQYYGQELLMYYTSYNNDVNILITGQKDLNDAVRFVDQNERVRSLRLLLARDSEDLHSSPVVPPGKLGELFSPTVRAIYEKCVPAVFSYVKIGSSDGSFESEEGYCVISAYCDDYPGLLGMCWLICHFDTAYCDDYPGLLAYCDDYPGLLGMCGLVCHFDTAYCDDYPGLLAYCDDYPGPLGMCGLVDFWIQHTAMTTLGCWLQIRGGSSDVHNNNDTKITQVVRRDQESPPPGFVPQDDFKKIERSTSRVSIEAGGEFIPEGVNLEDGHSRLSSSRSSVPETSDYGSHRIIYGSLRNSKTDNTQYQDDGTRSKTFPSRTFPMAKHSSHQISGDYPEGQVYPNSFPKRGKHVAPPGVPLSSISKGDSDWSVSTSSSSGLGATEPESPEGRRNTNHITQRLKQLSAHKSPAAPVNWQKGKILGAGAFGQVFSCYDKDTGRTLAVKQVQLLVRNSEISKEVKALQCEISLLKNLHHERIVQYYGSHEDDKVLSIFMEYMPGTSVKDHLKTYGALTEKVARKYTRQILEGLSYLHSLMIVHRDVKGANVLRDHSGNVKLGDFGASKRLQTICVTMGAHTVTGTPYWMSPEVINGEGYGRRADIWSLGCTLVEMLTTNPPWHEYESMAAIFKIATADHPKYELTSDTSDLARNFLKKCFMKNPAERLTAEQLLEHKFCSHAT